MDNAARARASERHGDHAGVCIRWAGLDSNQRKLLEAISRGDAETAERVATDHVLTFEKEIRQVI
jgi:DNA-binding FadR family transcriptional regulator